MDPASACLESKSANIRFANRTSASKLQQAIGARSPRQRTVSGVGSCHDPLVIWKELERTIGSLLVGAIWGRLVSTRSHGSDMRAKRFWASSLAVANEIRISIANDNLIPIELPSRHVDILNNEESQGLEMYL